MNFDSIDTLNMLLQAEIAAVETYSQALGTVPALTAQNVLALCRAEHVKRAQRLSERITELGGIPTVCASPWGAFIRLVAAGALVLDARPAIAILEEGEDLGLISYKEALKWLDPDSTLLVETELLPAQSNTYELIHDLRQG